jgi:hypothetical protein
MPTWIGKFGDSNQSRTSVCFRCLCLCYVSSSTQAKPTSCTTLRGSYTSLPNSFGSNQLASSKFLADEGVLVLITRGGDIASWNTTEEDAPVRAVHPLIWAFY